MDPTTGEVTAVAEGEVTISVTTGGITAQVTLAVQNPDSDTPPADGGDDPERPDTPGEPDDAEGGEGSTPATPIPGQDDAESNPEAGDGELAGTGAEVVPPLLITGALAATGLWLVLARRRPDMTSSE